MSDVSFPPDLLILFAQASAGLGHLRVTDALYHGMPKGVTALALHSHDKLVTGMHNIMSTHVVLRQVMEFTQHGWAEDVFARFWRQYLRTHTKILDQQLTTILEEHVHPPQTVMIIATHFALAHQVAAIKEEFSKRYNVTMHLFVVVTDDSPQHMWAVGGADLIVVPSEPTKRALEAYHKSESMEPATYTVLPYMVSPTLARPMGWARATNRVKQLTPESKDPLHIAVPISGAAVQLDYLADLIDELKKETPRCVFHIVSKKSPATKDFLQKAMGGSLTEVLVSEREREVIDLYEQLYQRSVIALEITKPSEQAFKALLKPTQRGGSVLLFSDPVGRQEWDNLAFLERHKLIPKHASLHTQFRFDDPSVVWSEKDVAEAKMWRALRLPSDGRGSARFVLWALRQGILAAMARFHTFSIHRELRDDGVSQFWDVVAKIVSEKAKI